MITRSQLASIMPAAKSINIDMYLDPINNAMVEFGIETPAQQAMFLAQIAHESGQLRWIKELWGPTSQQERYDPPDTLAAKLGNGSPGDGKRYRGRGLIQITGRANYEIYGLELGMDLLATPELLEQPVPAARSAARFWERNTLNPYADAGDIHGCTRKINGGLNGLESRIAFWETAKEVLDV